MARTGESYHWFTYEVGESEHSHGPDNHRKRRFNTKETLASWSATPVMFYWKEIKKMNGSKCSGDIPWQEE